MVDYDVVDKWDGKTLKYNIGNRVSGLLKIGFGGICIFGWGVGGGVFVFFVSVLLQGSIRTA